VHHKRVSEAVKSRMNVFFKSADVGFFYHYAVPAAFRSQFIRLLAAFKKHFMTGLAAF
jgi:hypothetical protein